MERRLAAIVCADVAGYSRMMGADEAGTHATFKAHRTAIHPIILNHGGRLVKNTGDGFLLEFPSIVGAIEAAIAMQALMAERNNHIPADRVMQFRMGVHMGDVMADEDEVFGDDVNIAVRLESVAIPGGVAISAKARGEAGKHLGVVFVDAGSHRFKNIEQPVHVWTWEPAGSDVRGREPSEASTDTSNLAAQYRTAIVGVLPFANLSDSTDEYFSDGLTEDLMHALSLQSFYRVLSRNSTFSFNGKNVSTRLSLRPTPPPVAKADRPRSVPEGAFPLLSSDQGRLRGLDQPVQGSHCTRSGAFHRTRLSRHHHGAGHPVWMDKEYARIVDHGDEPGGKQRSARPSLVLRISDSRLFARDGRALRGCDGRLETGGRAKPVRHGRPRRSRDVPLHERRASAGHRAVLDGCAARQHRSEISICGDERAQPLFASAL